MIDLDDDSFFLSFAKISRDDLRPYRPPETTYDAEKLPEPTYDTMDLPETTYDPEDLPGTTYNP